MSPKGLRAHGVLGQVPRAAAVASCLFLSSGCPEQAADVRSGSPETHEPSPNASIQPAPLEPADLLLSPTLDDAGATDAGATMSNAEAPPTALREDVTVPVDSLEGKEILGNELEGIFVWHDVPAPLILPDLDIVALNALREKTSLALKIHTTMADRASFVLVSPAFPLAQGTELRARRDRYGHLLLWPNRESYRPVPPGALRALLGERRSDVLSLASGTAEVTSRGKALGFVTLVSTVSSPFGVMEIEQAEIPGLAPSGSLLCRFLVELIGVAPFTSVCSDRQTPLRAEYRWRDGGKLSFVIKRLGRRREYDASEIAAPPATAKFSPGLLPPAGPQRLASEDLGRLRRQTAPAGTESAQSDTAKGLIARNNTAVLSAVLVNGVPVAWIAPGTELRIEGLKRGRYGVAFRDFLGQTRIPSRPIEVPGRIAAGDAFETTPSQ